MIVIIYVRHLLDCGTLFSRRGVTLTYTLLFEYGWLKLMGANLRFRIFLGTVTVQQCTRSLTQCIAVSAALHLRKALF